MQVNITYSHRGNTLMKKHMSNRRFRALSISLAAVLAVIGTAATVGANIFPASLDAYLGKGEKVIEHFESSESWDTTFYKQEYTNNADSVTAGNDLNLRITKEGDTLLKNNGLLPIANKSTVMPFGLGYTSPCYGQYGNWGGGKWVSGKAVTPEAALKQCFLIDNTAINAQKGATINKVGAAEGTMSVTPFRSNSAVVANVDATHKGYPQSTYAGISPVSNETAIVFIARFGEEGSDRKYDGYTDGTKHYYDLTKDELDMIKEAKRICGKVVVVLNSANVMEIDEIATKGSEYEVDGILWVGAPGESGFAALGPILNGDVNPSGKTPDIWPSDFTKDPTYANIGQFYYTINGEKSAPYVEYQEDIYMGYRFYETANDIGATGFSYGTTDISNGGITTNGRVNYPFGFGLSYTTFEKTLDEVTYVDGEINIKVTTKNTGTSKGKDIAEVYYTAPYTDYDKTNKIEKSSVTLLAFDKSKELEPGESETFIWTIKDDEMASYCSLIENADGTKGSYVLEGGDYVISLRENSHNVIDTHTINVSKTITYNNGNLRSSDLLAQSELDAEGNSTGHPQGYSNDPTVKYHDVNNTFEEVTAYMEGEMSSHLTRSDWDSTLPVADVSKVVRTKEMTSKYTEALKAFQNFDVETDPYLGNVEGSRVYNPTEFPKRVDSGIVLSDLRGKDYSDPLWDTLLDEINWKIDRQNIETLFAAACYTTAPIESIGLMAATQCDGSNGLKITKGTDGNSKTTTYAMEPIVGATWNEDLAYEYGAQNGEDALINGVMGQYSPGLNLHRTQFNARNHCYFSEDPLLTGKLGARIISGMGDKGLVSYVKHFALNDQDTNRDQELHEWATEQTMRELYLRAFEIAFKEATMTIKYISDREGTVSTKTMRAATGVMTAQCCIGWYWCHASYSLLNDLLRGEWGFNGSVLSDWLDNAASNRDMALRGGCDLYLASNTLIKPTDYTSTTAKWTMRKAIHNTCYAMANSNATQGVGPGSTYYFKTSPWRYWLVAIDVTLGLSILALGTFTVLRTLDEKKHPEKYVSKETA